MDSNSTLFYCKGKLQEVDYRQRLEKIYDWVKRDYIDQEQFIELVNFAVNLDLVPTED